MYKRILSLLIVLVMVLGLTGCSGGTDNGQQAEGETQLQAGDNNETEDTAGESDDESPEAGGGGILTMVTAVSHNSFFPADISGGGGFERFFTTGAIESLGKYTEDQSIEPWLASEFVVADDYLSVTIKLNEGILFHDGTPFNAEAVIANWGYYIEQGTVKFENVAAFNAVSEYEINVELEYWSADTLVNLLINGGRMVSPAFYEANGHDYCYSNISGTGAFVQADDFVMNENLSFVRAEGVYWDADNQPDIDGYTIIVCQDETTATSIFESGEADVYLFAGTAITDNLVSKGYSIAGDGSTFFSTIYSVSFASDDTQTSSPLTDVRVRQAFCYAVDQEAIGLAASNNLGDPVNQWAEPGTIGYNDTVTGYEYDVDKARELLAEAGYTEGECKIKLTYGAAVATMFTMIQAYLEEAGFSVEMEQLDSASMAPKRAGNGDTYDDAIIVATALGDWLMWTTVYNEGQYSYMWEAEGRSELTELYQAALVESDDAKLKEILNEIERLLIDEYCYVMPVYAFSYFALESDNVKNTGIRETFNYSWEPNRVRLEN